MARVKRLLSNWLVNDRFIHGAVKHSSYDEIFYFGRKMRVDYLRGSITAIGSGHSIDKSGDGVVNCIITTKDNVIFGIQYSNPDEGKKEG